MSSDEKNSTSDTGGSAGPVLMRRWINGHCQNPKGRAFQGMPHLPAYKRDGTRLKVQIE